MTLDAVLDLCSYTDCWSANQGMEFFFSVILACSASVASVVLHFLFLLSACNAANLTSKSFYVCRIPVHIYVFNGASQKYKSHMSTITSVFLYGHVS